MQKRQLGTSFISTGSTRKCPWKTWPARSRSSSAKEVKHFGLSEAGVHLAPASAVNEPLDQAAPCVGMAKVFDFLHFYTRFGLDLKTREPTE